MLETAAVGAGRSTKGEIAMLSLTSMLGSLPVARKFQLIALLALIAAGIPASLYIRSTAAAVDISESEVAGARPLIEMLDVLVALQEARGRHALVLAGFADQQAALDAALAKATAEREALVKHLGEAGGRFAGTQGGIEALAAEETALRRGRRRRGSRRWSWCWRLCSRNHRRACHAARAICARRCSGVSWMLWRSARRRSCRCLSARWRAGPRRTAGPRRLVAAGHHGWVVRVGR
jgi:hypothetical protein